jgi:hypothetical protein
MKLTIQQLQNLLGFLNRVQLQGNEAEELVRLKMIFVQEGQKLQTETKQVEPKAEQKNK